MPTRRGTGLLCTLLLLSLSSPAAAQYSKVVVFGDSGSDSGYYKTTPPKIYLPDNTIGELTVPADAGRFTTNPGLNWTQMLAQNLGLTAEPSNTPGGTNYAVGGARVNATGVATITFANVPSVHNQIASYLASAGGSADRSALHILMAGGNDNAVAEHLHPDSLVDQLAITTRAAADLVSEIKRLHAAGARHFLVANLFTGPGAGRGAHIRNDTFNHVLNNGITAAGIYVIRANVQGLMFGVYANPAAYGFTTIDPANPACVPNAANPTFAANGQNALWCLPVNLATPTAAQDHLFADSQGHFATAGQQLIADFVRDVIVNPSALTASVHPYGRSITFGQSAGSYATIKNNGTTTATRCSLALPPGIPATLWYSVVVGSIPIPTKLPTPVDIPAGATTRFYFEVTPLFGPLQLEIGLVFDCTNTRPAAVIPGLNTFIVTAGSAPAPDLYTQISTDGDTGIVEPTQPGDTVHFFASTTNRGAGGTVTASVDDGGRNLGVDARICQTGTVTKACISPPAASTTSDIAAQASVTYRVTATVMGALPLDLALNRLFLRLKTQDGFTRGAASVAIRRP